MLLLLCSVFDWRTSSSLVYTPNALSSRSGPVKKKSVLIFVCGLLELSIIGHTNQCNVNVDILRLSAATVGRTPRAIKAVVGVSCNFFSPFQLL